MTTNNQWKKIDFTFFILVKIVKSKNIKDWLRYEEMGPHPYLEAEVGKLL